MRRLVIVMALLAGALLVSTGTAAAEGEVSPGCTAINEFGTLIPTSPLIPESRHVMDSSFHAGEVVTVDFVGIVGSGWLSIADSSGAFGNPFLTTDSVPSMLAYTFDGSETGAQVFVIAASAEVRCGPQISDDGEIDLDGDGVMDEEDACDETDLAADIAPERQLRNRLWADADGTFVFGDGANSGFTVADTAGCSASQIIEATELGKGHAKFGISKGAFADHLEGQAAETPTILEPASRQGKPNNARP